MAVVNYGNSRPVPLDGPIAAPQEPVEPLQPNANGVPNYGNSKVVMEQAQGVVLPDLPEISSYGQEAATEMKIAAGLLFNLDPAGQADVIKAHIPDAKVSQVGDYYVVDLDGKRGYINKPGLSTNDFTQFTTQLLSYIPAARLAGLGANLLVKMGIGAAASGATSVGNDLIGGALGGEQGVSPYRAGAASVGGAAGEVAALAIEPLIRRGLYPAYRQLKSIMGAKAKDPMAVRAEIAKRIGVSPDDLTPDNVLGFSLDAERAIQTTPRLLQPTTRLPGGVGGTPIGNSREVTEALSDQAEFGIGATRGQATGNYTQLGIEESMRRGGKGEKAQGIMSERDIAANDEIAAAVTSVTDDLAAGTPTPRTENDAVGGVVTGVKNRADDLAARVDAAYNKVDWKGITSSEFAVDPALRYMDEALKASDQIGGLDDVLKGVIDKESYPAVHGIVNTLKLRVSQIRQGTIDGNIQQIEILRRTINGKINTAKNSDDRRLAIALKNGFDQWIDDTIDAGLWSGDPTVIARLKEARALSADYKKRFTANGDKRAGQIIEKMVSEELTPDQAVDAIFGVSDLVSSKASLDILKRIKAITGTASPEWNMLRQAAFLRLVYGRGVEIGSKVSAANFDKRLTNALSGRGEFLFKELFTREELMKFARLRRAVSRTQPKLQNPSGSADKWFANVSDIAKKLGIVVGIGGDPFTGAAAMILGKTALFSKSAAKAAAGGASPIRPSLPVAGTAMGGAISEEEVTDFINRFHM